MVRYLLESTFNSSTWPRPCLDDASCQSSDTVQLILVITVSTFLSVATVMGNALVLLSVKINRRLRSVNNYFLLSLAVADLAVGLISMNLYTMYHLCGCWPLGALLCDLWLVLDYWVGNASVLNLLLISLDRYFCVTRPFTYPSQRSGRMAVVMIAAVWLLALLIWAPAILVWQNGAGRRSVPDGHCYIILLSSPAGTLATTIPSFYLPALVMIGLYGRITAASRGRLGSRIPMVQQRAERRSWVSVDPETDTVNQSEFNSSFKDRRNKRPSEQIEGGTTSFPPCQPSNPNHDTNPNLNTNPNPNTIPDANTDSSNLNTVTAVISDINTSPDLNTKTYNGPSTNTKLALTGDGYGSVSSPTLAGFPSFGRAGRRRRVLARERRVTKTILSILLAFLLTWTPHNVMAVVAAFCQCRIPGGLWSAGYWLCYVNSTINPCCYALCNVTFRKTFRSILRCRRRNN